VTDDRRSTSDPAVPFPGGKQWVKRTAKEQLPEGSRGRAVARATLTSYREAVEFGRRLRSTWAIPGVHEGGEPRYPKWLRRHGATAAQLTAQREASRTAPRPVAFEVVVLPGAGPVEATLDSLREQTWTHWRATVCAPGAPAGDDKVTVRAAGTPAATAADEAVDASTAEFVILLAAGDRLSPEALYTVASTAHQDPLVDLVHWDDDRLDEFGRRVDPRFRPAWSPDMLLSANYLGRSFALRRARYRAAGGLRAESADALHWDLLLRCGLDDARVARVARVLGSVAARDTAVSPAAVRAVQDHLDRSGAPGTAAAAGDVVRVEWRLDSPPHVTVVIPTRHNRRMLGTCLPALAKTDYPSFDVTIVDNGGRSAENEQWYAEHGYGLELDVLWWTQQPFNYSAVNNGAVAAADAAADAGRHPRAEVLVFLNDDTETLDPGWLRELVGWATRPEIGCAGMQLIGPDGMLQHAGAVLGMNGFADHVFEGMAVGSDSLLGSTRWHRNVLAVTGACVAVRREVFDELGGFDERFILTGSDVALGLDAKLRGYRNVCSALPGVRHLESATRGTAIPTMDFFTSYWRYQTWLFGGDPYFSPNLSLGSRRPALRGPDEPTPGQRLEVPLGRPFTVFRQRNDAAESRALADMCRAMPADTEANLALHAANAEPFEVRTINWFIPDIDSPFYGGINSALRIADYLAREHGVENRFVVWGSPPDNFVRSALAAAFPALADCEIAFYDGYSGASLEALPEADVAIATLWVTAYAVAHAPNVKRKFYLIQDFEPMFYPASSLYALTEESYRLGLYGLCNTENLLKIYEQDYAGRGMSFQPAVDQSVFHARGRQERDPADPVTVFLYARPGHWRNCWEIASLALEELKGRLGDRVRIVTAGSWATDGGGAQDIKHLGLLPYAATGELYRNSDVGVALTVSKHPSYLPLELMACGVPVVAFDNPWGHWILRDGENSLLAKRTVDSLADRLERMCVDAELRKQLSTRALADIAEGHSDWDRALSGIYPYLCDPEGAGGR
jgi:GT2 family glycosyltransferase/glycosyltransferase involved in cell wall biosynthesis